MNIYAETCVYVVWENIVYGQDIMTTKIVPCSSSELIQITQAGSFPR